MNVTHMYVYGVAWQQLYNRMQCTELGLQCGRFRLLTICQNTLWKVIQHGLLFRGMGRVATCQKTRFQMSMLLRLYDLMSANDKTVVNCIVRNV